MRYFKFPAHIHYLFRVYLWGILCFTLFRIVLLVTQWENIVHVPQKLYPFSYAFLMGWRFDSSISGYLLVLPLLFFSIWRLAHKKPNWLASFGYYFINTTYILAFFICAIDIPYFDIFASRLNIAILNWVSHLGFGLGMVAKDPSNWAYTLFFFSISCDCKTLSVISIAIFIIRITLLSLSKIGLYVACNQISSPFFLILIN